MPIMQIIECSGCDSHKLLRLRQDTFADIDELKPEMTLHSVQVLFTVHAFYTIMFGLQQFCKFFK